MKLIIQFFVYFFSLFALAKGVGLIYIDAENAQNNNDKKDLC